MCVNIKKLFKNKREFYGMIHAEDEQRLVMLETRYKKLIEEAGLVEKFENVDYTYRTKKAELILLLFDILAYPFVKIDATKQKLLSLYNITDAAMQTNIINARENWFTTWSDFDFGKALDAKQSQEVY